MADLAIIIPAYKKQYFEQSLQSLSDQTNRNFHVYVGDDCSPQDLKPICDKFAGRLPISFTRFDTNMGAKRLVDQWSRCVALTKNEPWLWMFSDDDLVDADCVENFYAHLAATRTRFDIYRFNTSVIDGSGNLTSICPRGPEVETSEQMAYHLLKRQRGNSMGDHIFSREIYVRCGGFVFTEYAQGADWAMSISFSRNKGISVIPKSQFYWRFSGANISGSGRTAKRDMLNGHLQFLRWLIGHFQHLKQARTEISYDDMLVAVRYNLKSLLVWHYHGVTLANAKRVMHFLTSELGLTGAEALADLTFVLKNTSKTWIWLRHAKYRLKRSVFREPAS
jgi:glycosyltransferase involved in cell wall biosynthesis